MLCTRFIYWKKSNDHWDIIKDGHSEDDALTPVNLKNSGDVIFTKV